MRDHDSRRCTLRRPLVACFVLALAAGMASGAGAAPSAHEVASGLARLGPRPDGAGTQERAAVFLADALRRAGLQGVRTVPVAGRQSVVNIEGVLPGETDR